MKPISQRWFISVGAVALVVVLTTLARAGDSPATRSNTIDAPQSQAPSGSVDSPAAAAPNDGNTPILPPLGSTDTAPPPAYDSSREESAESFTSSSAPNMIGDMGGGPTYYLVVPTGSEFPNLRNLNVPSPSSSILGAQRLADNDCTLPTDRVFCDYSYFHDAQLASPSDANRFVPGFEKTFFDGRMSVEMRVPMGVLESNDIIADNSTFGTSGQFGDLQVIVKALLVHKNTWSLGTGLGISLPTAPDLNIGLSDGTPLLKIANNSTHLLPYVALLVTPNDDWFAQAFVQLDVAANGNAVSFNPVGYGLTPAGEIYDQTLIFADASIGRWLYRNPAQRFSGLAAVVEAHYTGGLNAPSTLYCDGASIGYSTARYNVLDLTIGAHAVIGDTTVTVGFATPATDDRGFDGELRLFVNRKF